MLTVDASGNGLQDRLLKDAAVSPDVNNSLDSLLYFRRCTLISGGDCFCHDRREGNNEVFSVTSFCLLCDLYTIG